MSEAIPSVMKFTPAQRAAIDARGNVLVMAGAGTGKTRTLVTRCLRLLLDPQADVALDEILMVTFTEAAAAEMRKRIREELEQELSRQPENQRLAAQLALLDVAHICTLHSFCLDLVRQNFYALELDPQLAVLAEEQSQMLAEEVLDELFNDHYAGRTPEAAAVQELIQLQARGWDVPIRELVLQIHEHTQTRPDPEGWFRRELEKFEQPEPEAWRQWLADGFSAWRDLWRPVLCAEPLENGNAHRCAAALETVAADVSPSDEAPIHPLTRPAGTLSPSGGKGTGEGDPFSERRNKLEEAGERLSACAPAFNHMADVLTRILAKDRVWPTRKKTFYRKNLVAFFEGAAFLRSLLPTGTATDPLAEDWQWIRGSMATLLRLAREFSRRFSAAKRERGAVDFHDLEQFALRLLWDFTSNEPTRLACQQRETLKRVFVDEYQDINEAQDRILNALGRDTASANRFLVGDVKQSIYRFRQANPRIFQRYAEHWRAGKDGGQTIDLSDNFRSRESLLQFVNSLFAALMRKEMGGVEYDQTAALKFGNPEDRAALSRARNAEPRVEVHLRLTEKETESSGEDSLADLSNADHEARLVARRLKELHAAQYPVWDEQLNARRPVAWRDMVVLLRSPSNKVEGYAKAFDQLDVPLQAKRVGFFESPEVLDLLSLLQLLDNPLQDVPAIAVLRSPLVGLSLDELAQIRLAARKARFWTTLVRWHEVQSPKFKGQSLKSDGAVVEGAKSVEEARLPIPGTTDNGPPATQSTWQKVDTFLARFARWRCLARHSSLTQRLELVLSETSYLDWLLTQSRGEQQQANVQRLLAVAREFDELQQQSLYRFLLFIEAQKEIAGDREPAPLLTPDAVRLMSIHQSKGLEFPVVVLADLGKPFNLSETWGRVVLDEHYGLCPQVIPPGTGQHYPSLPLWLARQRQRAEALGEELRVLYVALTRAQDTLILAGTCPAKTAVAWGDKADPHPLPQALLKANRYLDWLGPQWALQAGTPDWLDQDMGETPLWRWQIHRQRAGSESQNTDVTATPTPAEVDEAELADLRERVHRKYPHAVAAREPAKASVTVLRRRVREEADDEARPAAFLFARIKKTAPASGVPLTAAEVGTAHHRFLQWLSLTATGTLDGLRIEAARLQQAGLLSEAEAAGLDLPALARFWQSDLGDWIRANAAQVRRELPFTMRLTRGDLPGSALTESLPDDEFIVVQGVVDLAVLGEEIGLVDFKTDDVKPGDLADKIDLYRPQLQLYGLALEKIFHRKTKARWLHFLKLGRTVAI